MKRGRDDYVENDEVHAAALELSGVLERGIDVKLLALDRINQLIDHSDDIYANNIAIVDADAAFYLTELLSDSSPAVALRAAHSIALLTDHSAAAKAKLQIGPMIGLEANISKVLLNPIQTVFINTGVIEVIAPWLFSNIETKVNAANETISTLTSFNLDAKIVYLKQLVDIYRSGEQRAIEIIDTLIDNIDCKSNEDVVDLLCMLVHPLVDSLMQLRGDAHTQQTLSLLATLCERSNDDVVQPFRENNDISDVVIAQLLHATSLQTQDVAVHALWNLTKGDSKHFFADNFALMKQIRSKLKDLIRISAELDEKEEGEENGAIRELNNNEEVVEICYSEDAENMLLKLKALHSSLKRDDSYKSGGEEESDDDDNDALKRKTSCGIM